MIGSIDAPRADIRIVLADDHVVMRSGLRLLLETEPGFTIVAEAADAQAAARSVTGHRPDVLILDLNMPGDSALELIPRMREEAPGTGIVVLTMQRDPMFARQALRAGAYGYVLKDATDSELVLAVRLAAKGETYINPQLGVRIAAEAFAARPGDRANARSRSSGSSRWAIPTPRLPASSFFPSAPSKCTASASSRSSASPPAPNLCASHSSTT